MKLSKNARKISKGLYQLSFKDGRLDDSLIRSIADKVAAEKPRHYVDILKAYTRLVRLEIEKMHAVVESATELDAPAQAQLLSELRGKFGEYLTAEFKLVPELIGGLRVKLGSNVWDSSVLGNLTRLGAQLAQA